MEEPPASTRRAPEGPLVAPPAAQDELGDELGARPDLTERPNHLLAGQKTRQQQELPSPESLEPDRASPSGPDESQPAAGSESVESERQPETDLGASEPSTDRLPASQTSNTLTSLEAHIDRVRGELRELAQSRSRMLLVEGAGAEGELEVERELERLRAWGEDVGAGSGKLLAGHRSDGDSIRTTSADSVASGPRAGGDEDDFEPLGRYSAGSSAGLEEEMGPHKQRVGLGLAASAGQQVAQSNLIARLEHLARRRDELRSIDGQLSEIMSDCLRQLEPAGWRTSCQELLAHKFTWPLAGSAPDFRQPGPDPIDLSVSRKRVSQGTASVNLKKMRLLGAMAEGWSGSGPSEAAANQLASSAGEPLELLGRQAFAAAQQVGPPQPPRDQRWWTSFAPSYVDGCCKGADRAEDLLGPSGSTGASGDAQTVQPLANNRRATLAANPQQQVALFDEAAACQHRQQCLSFDHRHHSNQFEQLDLNQLQHQQQQQQGQNLNLNPNPNPNRNEQQNNAMRLFEGKQSQRLAFGGERATEHQHQMSSERTTSGSQQQQRRHLSPRDTLELVRAAIGKDHRLVSSVQKMAFGCHVCGSGFEDRHRLQQHLSIHLSLQPSWFEEKTIKETMAQYELRRGDYLCQLCRVRYETTTEFDKHMQLHGDKPHQCELCQQDKKLVSFRYFRQLLTHLRSHCFLYSCRFNSECKQTANRKDYLKLHILKHHLDNKLPEQYTICCH